MGHTIVSREAIEPGDRVLCIEDRPIGIVTALEGPVLEVQAFDSTRYRIPVSEVFTSTAHTVTLQFSLGSLGRFRLESDA